MKNIDEILNKTQYGQDDDFVSMYKNYNEIKDSEPEYCITNDKFDVLQFLSIIASFLGNFVVYQEQWHAGFYFLFTIIPLLALLFIWLYLNQEAISESFRLSNYQEKIRLFESRWLFNEKNFLPILEAIDFQSFPEENKNRILDMLATQKVDVDTLSLIHKKLLDFKKNMLSSKIPTKENMSADNLQFFRKQS